MAELQKKQYNTLKVLVCNKNLILKSKQETIRNMQENDY